MPYPKTKTLFEMLDSVKHLSTVYTACMRFVEAETNKGIFDPALLGEFAKSVNLLNGKLMCCEVTMRTPNTKFNVIPGVDIPLTETDGGEAEHADAPHTDMADTAGAADADGGSDDVADVPQAGAPEASSDDVGEAACLAGDACDSVTCGEDSSACDEAEGGTKANKRLLGLKKGGHHKGRRVYTTTERKPRSSWGPKGDENARAELLMKSVSTYIENNYGSFSKFHKNHRDLYMALWHRHMLAEFYETLRDYGVDIKVPQERLESYKDMAKAMPAI